MWCLWLFIISGVTGLSRALPPVECQANEFPCINGRSCFYKYKWCDGNYHCSDYSDETNCNVYHHECAAHFFRCDNGLCIPKSGRCDGYPSCSDGSDEFDCYCEELSAATGNITYSVHSGQKRTSKCWKITIPANKFLSLRLESLKFANEEAFKKDIPTTSNSEEEYEHEETYSNVFEPLASKINRYKSSTSQKSQSCNEVSLTVSWMSSKPESLSFCPGDDVASKRLVKTFSDTEIKHRATSRQYSGDVFDSFILTYAVADLLCMKPESFKCSSISCISMEKKCDGVQDCLNGMDEVGCEKGIFAVPGVNVSRNLDLHWLKRQRNAAWGWRDNTHRAIVALYLAKGANFNSTNLDEDLMAKQLELQMSTAILRNETDLITSTQLAMYINALLVICHDPRNFYGFDLVSELKRQIKFSKSSIHPLPYLALCNAKEILKDEDVSKLVGVMESPSNHSFYTDVQSVALMALACVGNTSKISELKENITRATDTLKKQQNEDGSFGNIYTTALVIQALLSSGHEEDTDWDLKAAVEFLKTKQSKDGTFGDFLATYLILPLLNSKSLVDIGRINCTESLKMPRDSNPISDIEFRLGPKISVKYYLYVGDQKDQVHPLFLRVPTNSTVLDMMRLAAEADLKYRFQAQSIKGKLYIYELFGIANDPEDEKFWLLYVELKNTSLQLTTKSANEVFLKNNDKIVMWYKTAQIY